MANLELPKFNAPEGYKNIFQMGVYDFMEHFGVTEEIADNILNGLCFSMMENATARERENILRRVLNSDEWNNYLNNGVFTYQGVTYNEFGEVM